VSPLNNYRQDLAGLSLDVRQTSSMDTSARRHNAKGIETGLRWDTAIVAKYGIRKEPVCSKLTTFDKTASGNSGTPRQIASESLSWRKTNSTLTNQPEQD